MTVPRDRGSADVIGLVLIAPAALALAVLVLAFGRQVDARAQVRAAAESAAQAGARQRTAEAAARAARSAAAANLVDRDGCPVPAVTVDVSAFRPGGRVTVTVVCTTSTRGLELIGARPVEFVATAAASIDPFRVSAP